MNMYEKLKDNPYIEYFDVKKKYDRRDMLREELREEYMHENERMKLYMNRYDNPFMNIPSYEDKMFRMFSKGDDIVIQEKIDGSNTHINVTGDGYTCYSNNYILNENNHLQGFWYWCRDHYVQVPQQYHGLDIYGEWLVPHHCEYPAERYGVFYVFDVMEHGNYWPQSSVEQLAKDCGFTYVPVFYHGEFQSWKHLMSYVGKTDLGGNKGEGIVVKNQSLLNSKKGQFYMKIVDVEFQETNRSRRVVKTVNMNRVLEMEEILMLTESIVTGPRVRKIILKQVEDGLLPAEWNVLDEQEILKVIKVEVITDCMKEEKEIVDKIGKNFGRYCIDRCLVLIKELKQSSEEL